MNLNYTLADLQGITGGKLTGDQHLFFRHVFIDSRDYFDPENAIFFAIKGDFNDGHDYLKELYEKGLKYCVVNKGCQVDLEGLNVLEVDDTLVALQELATFHRKQYQIPIIAITGSNGKTIVKEWLFHFLMDDYNIVRSPKSYNSQVGVPLSVLQLHKSHELAIFEAGISQPGEMQKLKQIIEPTHGVLTNIGGAHLDNFSRKEELRNEKLKLLDGVKFYSYQEEIGVEEFELLSVNIGSVTSLIEFSYRGESLSYEIPMTDEASIQNSLTCVLFLLNFGVPFKTISKKAATLPVIAFRLETKKGKNGSIIIDDFYNADLESLSIALNYMDRFEPAGKKCLILSDLKSDKMDIDELYRVVAERINVRKLDHFMAVGNELTKRKSYFKQGEFYSKTEDLLAQLRPFDQSIILIKGSGKFGFDRISEILEEKTHQTTLKINLKSLLNNLNTYRRMLRPTTKILGMVKAFGYGTGNREIAYTLQHAQLDYLGVAYTDEGVALLDDGVELPIIVMNAEEESFSDLIRNKLEPAVFSFSHLDNLIKKLIGSGLKNYPIHIKVDTGMHRLGFSIDDLENIVAVVKSQPEVRVKSVFTHLAASDESQHDSFTLSQLHSFKIFAHQMEESLGYKVIKHALNSTGVERFSEYQLDMVRLGLGMYGVSSNEPVQEIAELTTTITQIKLVRAGESIGYGRKQFAERDMQIAILPIGYADGFSRLLSNGVGSVFINGQKCRVVGNVCMDMTMVDVSGVDVKEGGRVEIFGRQKSVVELAKEMQTIPYEVMTSISPRVVRVYLED